MDRVIDDEVIAWLGAIERDFGRLRADHAIMRARVDALTFGVDELTRRLAAIERRAERVDAV